MTEDLTKKGILCLYNQLFLFVSRPVGDKLKTRRIQGPTDVLRGTDFSAELMTGRVLWQSSDKSLSLSSPFALRLLVPQAIHVKQMAICILSVLP